MQAFKTVTSVIAYLPIANIDTDMIIPKQYLKTIKRTGLGKFLFADMRYEASGKPNASFILNQSPYDQAQILLVEENFGCGSSREHAAWSLVDFGITVVIAPSFADIYYNNGFKNGILNIILSQNEIKKLAQSKGLVTIDLEKQVIITRELIIPFTVEIYRRNALLKGLDDTGETLMLEAEITAFERKQRQQQPWLYRGIK